MTSAKLSATVGEVLTADTSALSDADGLGTYSYQWYLGDNDIINGATSSSYELVEAEVGLVINVSVSYVDGAGNLEVKNSESDIEVTAAENATGKVTLAVDKTEIDEGNNGTTTLIYTIARDNTVGETTIDWALSGTVNDDDISVTPRIGVDYAEEDSLLEYRFLIDR